MVEGHVGQKKIMDAYRDPKLLAVFALGICSGLPNALVFGTLSIWLREEGLSRAAIGAIGLVGTAYALNFLFGPIADRVGVPVLRKVLGRRRSWGILLLGLLIVSLMALSGLEPANNLPLFATVVLSVACLSAALDVVIDASRIEYLPPERQAAGAAMATYGWMTGASVAGGVGALLIADWLGWAMAYKAMATVLLIGPLAYWLAGEPSRRGDARESDRVGVGDWISTAVLAPLRDFAKRDGWVLILLFVVFFKFGDAMLGRMANVFYLDIGFGKTEIAEVSKAYGLIAFLIGGGLGGLLAARAGTHRALLVAGLAMAATNLLYYWLAASGADRSLFILAVAGDNFTSGLATTIFVAYLSSLCSISFTATQYALLASIGNLARVQLGSLSGVVVDGMGGDWGVFFLITVAAATPGLWLAWIVGRRHQGRIRHNGREPGRPATD